MQIHITVSKHDSGRFTLMERTQMDMMPKDCREPGLFGNTDATAFYRAVAVKLNALHQAGHDVRYDDLKD
jgi:hypothetical protein